MLSRSGPRGMAEGTRTVVAVEPLGGMVNNLSMLTLGKICRRGQGRSMVGDQTSASRRRASVAGAVNMIALETTQERSQARKSMTERVVVAVCCWMRLCGAL